MVVPFGSLLGKDGGMETELQVQGDGRNNAASVKVPSSPFAILASESVNHDYD